MNEIPVGVQAHMKHVLVKWDGEPPEGAEPVGHPQCIEIIEIEDGKAPVTIYKRKD